MAWLFGLSDGAWAAIKPHLPRGKTGKPRVEDRRVISAHLEDGRALAGRSTRAWSGHHDLRPLQPLKPTRRLAAHLPGGRGRWRNPQRTQPRRHPRRSAPLGCRGKRGDRDQAIGGSRGGRTSKIHCLADPLGRPVAFAPTPGNIADIAMAISLLEAVQPPRRRIADKAYDAMSLRNWLKARRIKAVIPSTATRRKPFPLDRRAHKRRNRIERPFCRLKNWRRVATRYDRPARNYRAALALVSSTIA